MTAFSPFSLMLRGQRRIFNQPQVMGILNATPDSFFSGSRVQTEKEIAERAAAIVAEGGSIVDVGASPTGPGAVEVGIEEEISRLRKTLKTVRREVPQAIVSVDTFRPEVAQMAVEEFGADIINDVSGGSAAMYVMAGILKTPYILTSHDSTVDAVLANFLKGIAELRSCGVEDVILDPGYGFGKTVEENYRVLAEQERLAELGLPLLAGVSRKRMVRQLLGTSPDEALNGTTVVNTMALLRGASLLRVHDVREAVEVVKITSNR